MTTLQECLFPPTGQFTSVSNILLLGRQIFKSLKTNMCTQPKGTIGKCKALETALNKKLLSSHEHLEKCLFSPIPPVDHLREHECLFKEMQENTFLCEEKEFRDAVLLAYPGYNFDTYCDLMLNPTGCKRAVNGGTASRSWPSATYGKSISGCTT